MTADLLHRAAAPLRAQATAASPGPWTIKDTYSPTLPERDATYVATVDPRVGLAVADRLDVAAVDLAGDGWPETDDAAAAVARAILREET